MEINIHDLNILQKFVDNQYDYFMFKEDLSSAMNSDSINDSYAEEKWNMFTKCPIRYACGQLSKDVGEEFINKIIKRIRENGYKG